MITLLERRAAPAVEALELGWRRQWQAPSIRRDGHTYDAGLDRFLADLPLNGVRSQHSQRSYAYDLLVWVRFLDEARGKAVWQNEAAISAPAGGDRDRFEASPQRAQASERSQV